MRKRPLVGKVRVVELRCKNGEHPGFKITECHGGIFVDKVEAASLADKEGIVVGDQVQDVNGVSLLSANATKEYARLVLKAAAQSDVLILTLCYCGPLVRGSDASITSSSATSIDSLRGPTGEKNSSITFCTGTKANKFDQIVASSGALYRPITLETCATGKTIWSSLFAELFISVTVSYLRYRYTTR